MLPHCYAALSSSALLDPPRSCYGVESGEDAETESRCMPFKGTSKTQIGGIAATDMAFIRAGLLSLDFCIAHTLVLSGLDM